MTNNFFNPYQTDRQFDTRGTFKGLIFNDYIEVIPHHLTHGKKAYRGGYFYNCFNPEHDDAKPSLLIQPGNTQACIWKCFSGCPQHIFTNMFNTWLIQAGKIDIQKLPSKTLEGLALQGIISKDDYFSITDRRKQKSMSRYQTILDSRNIKPAHLEQLEADGTHHQQPKQPIRKPNFLQFAKERGFYG